MQAVIFTGIQASGKTSFYKDFFFDTHVRLSLDLLKTRNRESRFLGTCIDTRARFVVDNTNLTAQDRLRYISVAQGAGYEIIGYYFISSPEDSLERNRSRFGRQQIPEQGIRASFRRLQTPSLSEGYHNLYVVSLGADRSWIVTQIPG